MITVMVVSDGRREYLEQAWPSLNMLYAQPITRRVIHDDSGDPTFHAWLTATFPDAELVTTPQRSGFDGAMRSARAWLTDHDDNEFVWWHEQDFRLTRAIPLLRLADTLRQRPHLAQLALRRQPWNDDERSAGGIVEQHPDDYIEVGDHLEHRRFFTTNPALIPRRFITDYQWPTGAHSEGHFSAALFTDPAIRCGYWGPRDSGEWCEHIGHVRKGTGY